MHAAIYARYSTDDQQATSIDDQIRRCKEIASRNGYEIDDEFIFKDEAISGGAKSRKRRLGYQALHDSIEANNVRIIFTDELSRLTRDVEEIGRLIKVVEDNGLHIITPNGLDTRREGWQTTIMVSALLAKSEVAALAFRTVRGMTGQLERGYMIAQAPFGYKRVRDVDAKGKSQGTQWIIDEKTSEIVRQIFLWRHSGMTGNEIASRLQARGVPLPMESRCKAAPCWRPANVFRLLNNTIYRGVFMWNGSGFTQSKAKKTGKIIVQIPFERPECRLVSDEIWHACNPEKQTKTRSNRGGGKHLFSGLVRCGLCDAGLCAGGKTGASLYCPQCETLVRVGGQKDWIGYSSTAAAMKALTYVLEKLFTGEVCEIFHERLRERLEQGPRVEMENLKIEISSKESRLNQVSRLLLDPDLDTPEFRMEFVAQNNALLILRTRFQSLKRREKEASPETLAQQLATNPLEVLTKVLTGAQPVYKVRAVLKRLIQSFVLVRRPKRGTSVFRIVLRPGDFVAEISETSVLGPVPLAFEVAASVGAARPPQWSVTARLIDDL